MSDLSETSATAPKEPPAPAAGTGTSGIETANTGITGAGTADTGTAGTGTTGAAGMGTADSGAPANGQGNTQAEEDDGRNWRTRLIGALLLLGPLVLVYLLIALWPRPEGSAPAITCQMPPGASSAPQAAAGQAAAGQAAAGQNVASAEQAGTAADTSSARSAGEPGAAAAAEGEKPVSEMTVAQLAAAVEKLNADEDKEEKKEQWLPCATIQPFGEFPLAADVRLLLLVLLAGALGAYVHTAQSFASYLGNRKFKTQWTWWYALRVPIGSALALFVYFTARGGLITGTTPASETDDLNVFGIMSFAALSGLFSKQVIDKLAEVFSNFFKSDQDNQRKDKMSAEEEAAARRQAAG